MADFSALKQSIETYIKNNGNKEITGAILQNILLSMVTTMGDGAINDNASDISDIKGDIQNINGSITDINRDITDINGDITDINRDITDLNGDLSDEVNRAEGAEGTLQQNITAEENRAKGAETTAILFSDGKLVFKNAAGTVLYQLSVDSFLSAITTRLNTGALYAGFATPSTTPAALAGQEVFYLATQAGIYTNFHFNGGDDPIVLIKDGIYFIVSGTDDDDWNAEPMLQLDDVPTALSNNPVKSGGVAEELALGAVYDVSAKNPTAGPNNDGKWESLSALLSDANLNTLIPTSVRKGGMSVKFVQSSDNKYVQYRLMNQTFSTDENDWQGVDDEPTKKSKNLVLSGGVFNAIHEAANISESQSYDSETLELYRNAWIQPDGTLSSSSSARCYKLDIVDAALIRVKTASMAVGSTNLHQAYVIYNAQGEVLKTSNTSYGAFNIDETIDLTELNSPSYILIGASSDYVSTVGATLTKEKEVKDLVQENEANISTLTERSLYKNELGISGLIYIEDGYILPNGGNNPSSIAKKYRYNFTGNENYIHIISAVAATTMDKCVYVIFDNNGNIIKESTPSKEAYTLEDNIKVESSYNYILICTTNTSSFVFDVYWDKLSNEYFEEQISIEKFVESSKYIEPDIKKCNNMAFCTIKTDGSYFSSSTNDGYRINVSNINIIHLETILGYFSNVSLVAWAIFNKNGTLSRTSGAVGHSITLKYDITINENEEYFYFSVKKGDSYVLDCLSNTPLGKRIDNIPIDDASTNLYLDSEDIYEQFARLINSKNVTDQINNSIIERIQDEAFSDCTMVEDENNFYCVGVTDGADVYWSAGTKVKLKVIDKTTHTLTTIVVAEADKTVTCIDDTEVTFARGASMPNIIRNNDGIFILFTTVINNIFTLCRCKYNSGELEDYCICKFSNGESVSPQGFASLGYNLYSDNYAFPLSISVNANANFSNAEYNGDYFIGVCGADAMKYPFILKTSDFEEFIVYKQLIQNNCKAHYECSTAVLNGILYCATRNGKIGKFKHLIINQIDLSTGEILDTFIIRATDSRPCLFVKNSNVFLFYNFGEERYKARIINLTPQHGLKPIMFDLQSNAMGIGYSYIQIIDAGTKMYYYSGTAISEFNFANISISDIFDIIDGFVSEN